MREEPVVSVLCTDNEEDETIENDSNIDIVEECEIGAKSVPIDSRPLVLEIVVDEAIIVDLVEALGDRAADWLVYFIPVRGGRS